jgi:hypothetical protein
MNPAEARTMIERIETELKAVKGEQRELANIREVLETVKGNDADHAGLELVLERFLDWHRRRVDRTVESIETHLKSIRESVHG